jgi:hypothetical protein
LQKCFYNTASRGNFARIIFDVTHAVKTIPIQEAALTELLKADTPIECELIPNGERQFSVLVHSTEKDYKLTSFRGQPRTFVDPRLGFDWAKRIGFKTVKISLDLRRWPTN